MMRCLRLASLALCGALIAYQASAEEMSTDANIITGLDVSSSINAQETMLQIEGMAAAIRSPAILAAIQHGRHGRIGFAVFVWADGDYPELVSWRVIGTAEDAEATSQEISARLQSLIDSSSRSVGTLTNLSGAIDHASEMLRQAPFASNRAVLNIIGNGEDNVGEDPRRARDGLVAHGVTINGVVLGNNQALVEYYRQQIIGGPTAFVLSVNNADSFTEVFARKFVSEIVLNVEAIDRDHR